MSEWVLNPPGTEPGWCLLFNTKEEYGLEFQHGGEPLHELALAERLIACANACAGVTTAKLLEVPGKIEEFRESIGREMDNDMKSYQAMCNMAIFPPDYCKGKE